MCLLLRYFSLIPFNTLPKNCPAEIRDVLFERFRIKINLINSAPFSLLGSDNGDKGMHYIPQYELDKLNQLYDSDRFEFAVIAIPPVIP